MLYLFYTTQVSIPPQHPSSVSCHLEPAQHSLIASKKKQGKALQDNWDVEEQYFFFLKLMLDKVDISVTLPRTMKVKFSAKDSNSH